MGYWNLFWEIGIRVKLILGYGNDILDGLFRDMGYCLTP